MVKPGNSAKKQCRKAERKWRRTDSDFLMFKAKKNHGTFIFRNAMRNYHTDFIQENSYDQYKLFMSTKILFDQDTDLTHQKYCDSTVLANDIRNFLVQKIKRIHTELDAVATGSNPHSEPASVCSTHFDWFSALSDDDVMHLIANKIKLEVLLLGSHSMPLVVECHYVLSPVLTRMLNLSLETGSFPDNWKQANVHPRLKKPWAEVTFNNLCQISNLSFVSKLVERAIFSQTHDYLTLHELYPKA